MSKNLISNETLNLIDNQEFADTDTRSPYYFVSLLLSNIEKTNYAPERQKLLKSFFYVLPHLNSNPQVLIYLEAAAKKYPNLASEEIYKKEMTKRWFENWKVGLYDSAQEVYFKKYWTRLTVKQQKLLSVIVFNSQISITPPPSFNIQKEAARHKLDYTLEKFNHSQNTHVIQEYIDTETKITKEEGLTLFATLAAKKVYSNDRYQIMLEVLKKSNVSRQDLSINAFNKCGPILMARSPQIYRKYIDYLYSPTHRVDTNVKDNKFLLDFFIQNQNTNCLDDYGMGFLLVDNFINLLAPYAHRGKYILSDTNKEFTQKRMFDLLDNLTIAVQENVAPLIMSYATLNMNELELNEFKKDASLFLLQKFKSAQNFDDIAPSYTSFEEMHYNVGNGSELFSLYQEFSQIYLEKKLLNKMLPTIDIIDKKDKAIQRTYKI